MNSHVVFSWQSQLVLLGPMDILPSVASSSAFYSIYFDLIDGLEFNFAFSSRDVVAGFCI